jgi:hypothetical protein
MRDDDNWRKAAMMIGEVDRRETADKVKRSCPELRGCCGESSSTGRAAWREDEGNEGEEQ